MRRKKRFDYVSQVFVLDDDDIDDAAAQVATSFEVKIRKSVVELNDRDVRYYKKKKVEWMAAAERLFDAGVAPGHSPEELKKAFDQPVIPKDVKPFLENFADSDRFGKLVILSLVYHNEHALKTG